MDPTADKAKQPYGKWLIATKTVESRRGRGPKPNSEAHGTNSAANNEEGRATPTSTTRKDIDCMGESSLRELSQQITLYKEKGIERGTKTPSICSVTGSELQPMAEGNDTEFQVEGSGGTEEGENAVRSVKEDAVRQATDKGSTGRGEGERRADQIITGRGEEERGERPKGSRKGWKRRAKENGGPQVEKGGKHEGPKRRREPDDTGPEAPEPKLARNDQEPRTNQELTAEAAAQPRRVL